MLTQITDCTVYPYNAEGSLEAFAQVTLNTDFVIKGIRLIKGKNGLFIAFPENRKDEKSHPICFPITASLRERVRRVVIDEFKGVPWKEEIPQAATV